LGQEDARFSLEEDVLKIDGTRDPLHEGGRTEAARGGKEVLGEKSIISQGKDDIKTICLGELDLGRRTCCW